MSCHKTKYKFISRFSLIGLVAFFIFTQKAHGQFTPNFSELRPFPTDTNYWNRADIYFKNNNPLVWEKLLDSAANYFIKNNNWNDFLFVTNQKCRYYKETNRYKKGSETEQAAIEKAKPHIDTLAIEFIYAHYRLSAAFRHLNQYNLALKYALIAIKNLETSGNNQPFLAYIYNQNAATYKKMNNKQAAFLSIEKAQKLALQYNDYPNLALSYYKLALLLPNYQYQLRIKFLKYADTLFDKADIKNSNYETMPLATSMYLYRTYYNYLEDLNNSLYYINKTDSLIKNFTANTTLEKRNIFNMQESMFRYKANIYRRKGQLNKAMDCFYTLSPFISRNIGAVSTKMHFNEYNKARIFRLLHQYDSAEVHYNKGFEIGQQLKWKRLVKYYYYDEMHQLELARENYLNALKYAQAGLYELCKTTDTINNPFIIPTINPKAKQSNVYNALMQKTTSLRGLYKTKRNPMYLKAALKHCFVADSIVNHLSNMAILDESGIKLSEKLNYIASNAIEICIALTKEEPYGEFKNNILYFLNRLNANYLTYRINQVKQQIRGTQSTLISEQTQLKQKAKHIENRLTTKNDSVLQDSLLKVEIAMVKNTINYENEYNYQAIELTEIPYEQLSESIPDGAALLVYHLNAIDSNINTFVIDNNTFFYHQQNYGSTLQKNIQLFIRGLKSGNSFETNHSFNLSQILINPLKEKLSNYQKLIIFPDNELVNIPFETLTFSSNSPTKEPVPLINKFSIIYSYSPILWLKNKNNQPQAEKGLYASCPVFSNQNQLMAENNQVLRNSPYRSYNQLPQLPYSLNEIEEISTYFENRDINNKTVSHKQASEKDFRENAKNYKFIHLATHGYYSKNNPNISGLFFEKSVTSSQYKNDGFLSVNEIYELQLNTDLLVLSACQTGSGLLASGEGVLGLPRAFFFAGVSNVMVSLWKIHDQWTQQLMVRFYNHYFAGNDYATALQKAKIDLINQGALPLDWSGIVLIGQ